MKKQINLMMMFALMLTLSFCGGGGGSSSDLDPNAIILSALQGSFNGTFDGDISGNYTIDVAENGSITGSGTRTSDGQAFDLSGKVDSEGNFRMRVVDTDYLFKGKISEDGVITGTWSGDGSSGTTSGTKIQAPSTPNDTIDESLQGTYEGQFQGEIPDNYVFEVSEFGQVSGILVSEVDGEPFEYQIIGEVNSDGSFSLTIVDTEYTASGTITEDGITGTWQKRDQVLGNITGEKSVNINPDPVNPDPIDGDIDQSNLNGDYLAVLEDDEFEDMEAYFSIVDDLLIGFIPVEDEELGLIFFDFEGSVDQEGNFRFSTEDSLVEVSGIIEEGVVSGTWSFDGELIGEMFGFLDNSTELSDESVEVPEEEEPCEVKTVCEAMMVGDECQFSWGITCQGEKQRGLSSCQYQRSASGRELGRTCELTDATYQSGNVFQINYQLDFQACEINVNVEGLPECIDSVN